MDISRINGAIGRGVKGSKESVGGDRRRRREGKQKERERQRENLLHLQHDNRIYGRVEPEKGSANSNRIKYAQTLISIQTSDLDENNKQCTSM